jgi:hypothetical protein
MPPRGRVGNFPFGKGQINLDFFKSNTPEKFTTLGSDYNGKVTALLGRKLNGYPDRSAPSIRFPLG